MGVKTIARRLGLARNTVRAALRSVGPPSYERARKGSIIDAVEPAILELLRDWPDMAATTIRRPPLSALGVRCGIAASPAQG